MDFDRIARQDQSSNKRMMDIAKIVIASQEQIITLGKVKCFYSSNEIQDIIKQGTITKQQLFSKISARLQSKPGYKYVLLQNMRRQASILVKTDQNQIQVGDIYLFIGKARQFYEDFLFLEGSFRKMQGSCIFWEYYLKLLENYKFNRQEEANNKSMNKQSQKKMNVVEIDDD